MKSIWGDESAVIKLDCIFPRYMDIVDDCYVILDVETQVLLLVDRNGRQRDKISLGEKYSSEFVYLSKAYDKVYIESWDGIRLSVIIDEKLMLTKWDKDAEPLDVLIEDTNEFRVFADTIIEADGKTIQRCIRENKSGDSRVSFFRICDLSCKRDIYIDESIVHLSNKVLYFLDDMTYGDVYLEDDLVVFSTESCKDNLQTTYLTQSVDVGNEYSQKTRAEAITTAYQYTSAQWFITRDNQKTLPKTRLASYIAGLDLTSGGRNLYGIPYCWGGWDTIAQFNSGISAKGQASNVTSANGNHVTGTYGIDCSGLVSRAYGLSTKYGTSMLGADFSVVSFANMCSGDFMLKNGHVVLFHRKLDTQNYLIVDSTTGNIEKVTSRVLSQATINSEGYVPHTGWSSAHVESTNWDYDSIYHYHSCANGCGKKYTRYMHSWIQYQGYRQCSVCGCRN